MAVTNTRLFNILDGLMYGLLAVSCLVIPFVVDTSVTNPYVLPKVYVMLATVMLGMVLWTVRSLMMKKIVFYKSALDKIFLPLLSIAFLSVLFSDASLTSLLGRNDYFAFSFIFLLGGWLTFTLINHTLHNMQRWQGFIDMLVGVGALTAVILSSKLIFDSSILASLTNGLWSSIDSSTSLVGVWFAVIFLLSAGQLIKKDIPVVRQLLYLLGVVSTFVALLTLNYTLIWWMIIACLALLVFLGNMFLREVRMSAVIGLFAGLMGIVILVFFGVPKIGKQEIPAEIVLNNASSMSVALGSITSGIKNGLVGNGLGTFQLAFSHFRNVSFNADPSAWSLRFNQPFSSIIGLATEGGLLLVIAFISVFLYCIGLLIKGFKLSRTKEAGIVQFFSEEDANDNPPLYEVMAIGAPWLLLTVGMFLYSYGPVLWWMWWVLTACLVVGLSFTQGGLFTTKEFRLTNKPEYTLSLSFIAVVVVAFMFIAGIGGARVYAAEKSFKEGLAAEGEQVETLLKKAISLNKRVENYHVALAQYYLSRATELSRKEKPDVQEIGLFVERAVNQARVATDLAPRSVVVWENLAVMYENASALIQEARAWALTSLERAHELETTNPILVWKMGTNHVLAGNYNEAVKKFEQAVSLKLNFVPGYISLAQAYEQTRDLDKAIIAYENALRLDPNNMETVYNYGRALYNRNEDGDQEKAEKIWTALIEVQPNYSNALFSLATLYEKRGERAKALALYRKVAELNPDNKDIKAKVNNLSR